jgi:hypothetical protein
LSPLYQRTSILACRAKRLIAGDRRYDLVIVPRAARLARRLHLHEVHVVQEPPVFAELAVLCKEIIDGYFAHFGHDRFRFVSARCLNRAQIMANCGVDGSLPSSRLALMPVEEAFGPGASFVITNEFGLSRAGQTLVSLLVFITDIHSLGLTAAHWLMLAAT